MKRSDLLVFISIDLNGERALLIITFDMSRSSMRAYTPQIQPEKRPWCFMAVPAGLGRLTAGIENRTFRSVSWVMVFGSTVR